MSRGSESPEAPSELVEQPTGPGSKLHESEMRYIATTLSPSALEGQEDRHVDRPSGASPDQEHGQADDGELYERIAKIKVKAPGGVRNTIHFLNQLRVNPYLRILQMTGDSDSVTVSLALRRPLRLKRVFSEMAGVSEVSAHRGRGLPGSEHQFAVLLEGEPQFSAVA